MKAIKVNFQDCGTSHRQRIGIVFLILVILCAGCTPSSQINANLPITDGEVKANIAFSPEMVDFGTQIIDTTSAAHKVAILNDAADPLVIDEFSVTAGFSIVANTCPLPTKAIASQGTCTVEIVFKPNLPQDWVGELQLKYGSGQSIAVVLKGTARLEHDQMVAISSGYPRTRQVRPTPPVVIRGH